MEVSKTAGVYSSHRFLNRRIRSGREVIIQFKHEYHQTNVKRQHDI